MPSLHRLLPLVALCLRSTHAATKCPSNAASSCSDLVKDVDRCCTSAPGGLVLFRQRFEPDVGDEGTWGIDGVELLDCDGGALPPAPSKDRPYTHEQIGSFCHKSVSFGPEFELAESEWASSEVGEGVEEIWERAWLSSGRQVTTLEPACFSDYSQGEEVPLYFSALHKLHRTIPTFNYLALSDITPSEDISYSLSELKAALAKGGMDPFLTCVNDTLTTVSWPLHVIGPFQDADFLEAKMPGPVRDSCPKDGIHYPPAQSRPAPTPAHTWDPIYRPSPRPLKNIELDDKKRKQIFFDGDDKIVDEKLSIFKKKTDMRDNKKDSQDEWGQRKRVGRDEL